MGELILTLVYGISELPNGETHMGLAERALGGILYTFTREFQVACIINRISRQSRTSRTNSHFETQLSIRLSSFARGAISDQEEEQNVPRRC